MFTVHLNLSYENRSAFPKSQILADSHLATPCDMHMYKYCIIFLCKEDSCSYLQDVHDVFGGVSENKIGQKKKISSVSSHCAHHYRHECFCASAKYKSVLCDTKWCPKPTNLVLMESDAAFM